MLIWWQVIPLSVLKTLVSAILGKAALRDRMLISLFLKLHKWRVLVLFFCLYHIVAPPLIQISKQSPKIANIWFIQDDSKHYHNNIMFHSSQKGGVWHRYKTEHCSKKGEEVEFRGACVSLVNRNASPISLCDYLFTLHVTWKSEEKEYFGR